MSGLHSHLYTGISQSCGNFSVQISDGARPDLLEGGIFLE